MTAPMLRHPSSRLRSGARSYWDGPSKCRIVVTMPPVSPVLWQEYLDGALANYRKHGVDSVLDYEQVRDGQSTSLFFAAVAADGCVVGGMRAQGPYVSAEQSHAVAEWAGEPGQAEVRKMISDRLPFGVVETKTAWVSDGAEHRRELVDCLSRAPIHAAMLLRARFALGTSAVHTLRLWTATGAVVEESLAPVPYPDDRYRTSMLWWDCETYAQTAERGQLRHIRAEGARLSNEDDRGGYRSLAAFGAR